MATILAPTLGDVQYSGTAPSAFAHGTVTLLAAAISDKARLVKLFAGTKIHDARLVNAALGASTTIAVGIEYCGGESATVPDAILAATSTASAASTRMAKVPFVLPYDAYVTATVGGAVATGQIDVDVAYEFKGI